MRWTHKTFRKQMRWREKFFWVKICDNELGGHLPHTLCILQPQPFYNFFPLEAKKRLFFEECSMCIKHRKYREKWPLGGVGLGQGAGAQKS